MQILTWNNKLSGFVVKCVTHGVVGGNRVLVYPGVKSVLVVRHVQPLNLETTIPAIHRSNQAGYASEFASSTLACVKYRWVPTALVQVPYNSEASGTIGTVGETARNDDTWASHACDAARGIEGPTAGEHIPLKKKKKKRNKKEEHLKQLRARDVWGPEAPAVCSGAPACRMIHL